MHLLYLALAYLLGVGLGPWAWRNGLTGCATPAWLWLLPLGLLPLTPWLNRLRDERAARAAMRWPAQAGFEPVLAPLSPALLAALLLCGALGLLRYAARPLTPCWESHDLAAYTLPAGALFDPRAPQATLQGYVASYPLVDDTRQRMLVAVEQMQTANGWQPVQGLARVTTGSAKRYSYGQPLQLVGRLAAPGTFDDFDYRAYLARQQVYSVLVDPEIAPLAEPRRGAWWKRQVYALRARGEAVILRALPEPYAALANGILLGIDAGIPDALNVAFTRTGASHVLVISGSNVALLAGTLLAVGSRLWGSRRAWLPTLAAIALYAVLVGGEAAVVRAAVMGGLVVAASGLRRRSVALVSLAAACWAMTLANPLALWDVSFQLSAAATVGLILLVPRLTTTGSLLLPQTAQTIPRGLVSGVLVDGLAVSLAASVMVMPLLAYHFGRVTLLGLLANLLIVPVQPWIMAWGSAGVIVGMAGLPQVAQALLWLPWLGLVWTVHVVETVAALPGAQLTLASFDGRALAASYGLLALLLAHRQVAAWGRAALNRLQHGSGRRAFQPALIIVLAAATILLWWGVIARPDGRLHVWFLDVDQGDGILIQTPGGRQVLVDGGRHPALLLAELGATMPFWDRNLDLVALTHPDSDHMDAQVEAIRRLAVGQAIASAPGLTQPEAEPWLAALQARGTPLIPLHAGGWVDLGDGVALWVLGPPPLPMTGEQADNENSLVLKLVYGDFSLLLTGDAGLASEARWLNQGAPLAATVLKVGHHGSAGSTGPELVAAVDPQVAVIQVGADNPYGHPAPEVLASLSGRTILRTDQMGRIHLASDGRQMWVTMERSPNPMPNSTQ